MKVKKGLNLVSICGEYVIVSDDKENVDLCNIISMNESSAYLWKEVQDKDFTVETLAMLLVERYEIEKDIALADAAKLIKQWEKVDIIE